MNVLEEKYLPIGSVVLLRGGTKRMMIIGFCPHSKQYPNQEFDYSGCVYPEGFMNGNEIGLFRHDQIEKIYARGFSDAEERQFQTNLQEIINKIR